jgi:hypothetical protein
MLGVIHDLRGRRFARLTILSNAEPGRGCGPC